MAVNLTTDVVATACDIAKRAGVEILKIYNSDFAVEAKDDSSPVTEADRIADDYIVRAIKDEITDTFPIISEEAFAIGQSPEIGNGPFWLVDPLDGTKEFIKRNGEFTVNIALIDGGIPVFGVVHAPAIKNTYWGSPVGAFTEGEDGTAQPISCRPPPEDGLVALVSRSHRSPEIDTFLADFTVKEETSAGSSLKFCLVAAGRADIYPRLGRTMEWDTAAGEAVVRFAGGHVSTVDGVQMTYGKPGFENPHFVVWGSGF